MCVSTDDEDGPLRRKRKCLKSHKSATVLGVYACDQCEKIFCKQSSLARHKYEHSGKLTAVPFWCDVTADWCRSWAIGNVHSHLFLAFADEFLLAIVM